MRKFAALLAAALAMVMAPIALAGNGSFETGDFTDWSVDAPSGDATVLPGGGTRRLRVLRSRRGGKRGRVAVDRDERLAPAR